MLNKSICAAFNSSATRVQVRLYVKQLSWCKPSTEKLSATKKFPLQSHTESSNSCITCHRTSMAESGKSFEPFGTIAAAAFPSHIIAVDGRLPWENKIPEDRLYYEAITRGRVLIMGRKTFESDIEEGDLKRAFRSIVVSSTMRPALDLQDDSPVPYEDEILIARSFQDALIISSRARKHFQNQYASLHQGNGNSELVDFNTWVVGGEKIYTEALKHPSSEVIHLTKVDFGNKSLKSYKQKTEKGGGGLSVAKFPMSYTWDIGYYKVKNQKMNNFGNLLKLQDGCFSHGQKSEFEYSLHIYKRKRRPNVNDPEINFGYRAIM